MAAAMKTDNAPDIVEIIDDDSDPFGERATSHTMHDTGGQRWIGPAAAIALVALIGYGVATSTSTNGPPKAQPPATTTATTITVSSTTAAITSTTLPTPAVPYYAATPPAEYELQFAANPVEFSDPGSGAYELWATPNATATSGSWFSVETHPGDGILNTPDSYRSVLGGVPVTTARTVAGQTIAQFVNGRVLIMITSFGESDEQLARLVASVTTSAGNVIGFNDGWFSSDHQLISRVRLASVVQGQQAEQVFYSRGDLPTDYFGLFVGRPLPDSYDGPLPDRQTALRFTLTEAIPFEVDGHSGVAGRLTGEGNFTLATWTDGDNIVSVQAAVPVATLITLARTVRRIGPTEWESLLQQQSRGLSIEAQGASAQPVSFGTDTNGTAWTISALRFSGGAANLTLWSWADGSWQTFTTDAPQVNSLATDRQTLVFASVPRSLASSATLNILRDGLDPVAVPFVDVDPNSSWLLAAYAFSEAVPFSAEIVGPDGTMMTTWTP
jgi:hypothetical protein